MRVALIGHSYILEANRGKLRALAALCGDFLFIAPEFWPEPDFGPRRFEPPSGLRGVSLPARAVGRVRRYHYHHGALKKTLRSFRPDLVHIEAEAGSAAGLQTARVAGGLGCSLTQFCWENLPSPAGIRKYLAKRNLGAVDHLFCGSRQAGEVARRTGYRRELTVIPQLGVDLEEIQSAPVTKLFDASCFTAGFVGRLDRKKGVHDIIEALQRPECADIRFVFVGDGPERHSLEEAASSPGLKERVAFSGAVPHEKTAGFIKGFSVLVLPSRSVKGWREQFGHVLIEAMSLGVPVIGSESGAIPEVIGDAGLLAPEGEPRRLAEAMASLKSDPDKARRLARAGLARTREVFTNRAIAARMMAAWRSIGGLPARMRK